MKKPGLSGFVLVFLLAFGFNSNAQEATYKDPASVKVGDLTIKGFVKTYKGVIGELGIPLTDEQSLRDQRGQANVMMEEWGYDMSVFRSANMSGTDLSKVNFNYITLSYANLSGCKLEKAKFRYALLQETNFSNAYLVGVDFTKANMRTANLKGADLTGANLKWANLENATGLTAEQLSKVKSLANVRLPKAIFDELMAQNSKLFK